MKAKIIFATKNKGKIKEIQMILGDEDYEVLTMEEAGIHIDVVEDGDTFEANALKKAVEIRDVSGEIVLADDSGLEVDFLGGEPGVYSARYGGVDTPYSVKNQLIIHRLEGVEGQARSARFVSVIAAAFPDGTTRTIRGTVEGVIGHEERGTNGFGYDPIFHVPEYDLTTAQMPVQLKNEISHRGKALRAMKPFLDAYIHQT